MKEYSKRGLLNVRIALPVFLMVAGGIWQQREISRLRTEHVALLDLARSRGIDPYAPEALPAKPYPRRDLMEGARTLAGDLIRRAAKGASHQADWAGQMEIVDRLEALNPAQLKEVLRIVLDAGEMPEQRHLWISLDLLERLADDIPEEALARSVEMESRLPENFPRYNFFLLQARIAGRFAEQSPEAAWKWVLDEDRKGWEGGRGMARAAVLGGIARADPAAALRRAEEAGVPGTSILLQHCHTLDQKVAALTALRSWSGNDGERRAKLDEYIQKQTLKHDFQETVQFDAVTGWIEQAGLTTDEIGFMAKASTLDLSYHIDPRDTGKWIEWLNRTFPEEQAKHQMKRLIKDHRTQDAAKAWLATLPPEEAAALVKRLGAE